MVVMKAQVTAMKLPKTKMCKFEMRGLCTKGSGCLYAHSIDELQPLPDFRCTKFCKALIQTGACNNPGCTFAHSKEELRTGPKLSATPSKPAEVPPANHQKTFRPPPGLEGESNAADRDPEAYSRLVGSIGQHMAVPVVSSPWSDSMYLPVPPASDDLAVPPPGFDGLGGAGGFFLEWQALQLKWQSYHGLAGAHDLGGLKGNFVADQGGDGLMASGEASSSDETAEFASESQASSTLN
mmetsp:Transcript_79385/g.224718  ORF Transcript_79385/g.224718 Transcript_79385/m.224718 type:complete len:239 (+) Transcript_79385:57-773(+)